MTDAPDDARPLTISYAGVEYWDRLSPLLTGAVSIPGVQLAPQFGPLEEIFRAMIEKEAYDASEMSLSRYLQLIGRGDTRLVGLPIFPSRHFRLRYAFVRADSDIRSPGDLAGRTVGVPGYELTAALWIRGYWEDRYGVASTAMRWRYGGIRSPYPIRVPPPNIPGLDIEQVGDDESLEGLLASGGIDAMISPIAPEGMYSPRPTARPLLPDAPTLEREYLRETGVFPIMHMVVLRREVYERDPWLARSLTDGFEQARRVGRDRLRSTGQLAVALPWLDDHLAELDELFGGRDPWEYGVEPNRRELEVAARYANQQGITAALVGIEELFAPECLTPA